MDYIRYRVEDEDGEFLDEFGRACDTGGSRRIASGT